MSVDDLKTRARRCVDELMPELVALSNDIFAHPELRFQEHHAVDALARLLRVHGADVEVGATVDVVNRKSDLAQFPFYTEETQNPALQHIFRANLDTIDVPHRPYTPNLGQGSTDFANLSREIPGMHLILRLDGTDRPPLTIEFAAAAGSEHVRKWLREAPVVMALSAIDVLHVEGVLEQVRRDFQTTA